ncbi:trypsin-1-like isoform X1 [Scylla paramamosain]|uniref:trypsin-1-like isoform X1 n=1 Tax=Scylla paramamosain TaxID=85552 RepID=UPI003082D3E7
MKVLLALFCICVAGIHRSHGRTYNAPLPASHTPNGEVFPGTLQKGNEYSRGGSDLSIWPRIVGGTEAEKHEFPWVVALLARYEYIGFEQLCGASVIDEWWVMTAAHCKDPSIDEYKIIAGEHNLEKDEEGEQHRKVATIVIHPEWDSHTMKNDIALMKLSEPLELDGKTVSPIRLPSPLVDSSGDCVVAGWGRLREGSLIGSDILMKVTVPLITDEECEKLYDGVNINETVSHDTICAGYHKGGKGPCHGDSGGSLVCQGPNEKSYAAGVVSWSYQCAQPDFPAVYTEVSHYIDWITQVRTQQ